MEMPSFDLHAGVLRFGEDWMFPTATGADKEAVLNVFGIGDYDGTASPGLAGDALWQVW